MGSLAASASRLGAALLVFPEFGLLPDGVLNKCGAAGGRAELSALCAPLPFVGEALALDSKCEETILSPGFGLTSVACFAKAAGIAVAVNVCAADPSGRLYNAEVVIDARGAVLAVYRKTHPFYPDCFAAPPEPDLTLLRLGGIEIGVFTCLDILFPTPAAKLLARGTRVFIYSSAIEIVGAGIKELFTLASGATLISSDSATGEGGVFVKGGRVTRPPDPSGKDDLLLADI